MILALIIMGILLFGGLFYGSLSWGFVMYKFWGWFFIPFFEVAFPEVTINPINYWTAVTLFIFLIFFRMSNLGKKSNKENFDWGLAITAPWVVLFMGWFIKFVFPI